MNERAHRTAPLVPCLACGKEVDWSGAIATIHPVSPFMSDSRDTICCPACGSQEDYVRVSNAVLDAIEMQRQAEMERSGEAKRLREAAEAKAEAKRREAILLRGVQKEDIIRKTKLFKVFEQDDELLRELNARAAEEARREEETERDEKE
jgi:hypothetical protein